LPAGIATAEDPRTITAHISHALRIFGPCPLVGRGIPSCREVNPRDDRDEPRGDRRNPYREHLAEVVPPTRRRLAATVRQGSEREGHVDEPQPAEDEQWPQGEASDDLPDDATATINRSTVNRTRGSRMGGGSGGQGVRFAHRSSVALFVGLPAFAGLPKTTPLRALPHDTQPTRRPSPIINKTWSDALKTAQRP